MIFELAIALLAGSAAQQTVPMVERTEQVELNMSRRRGGSNAWEAGEWSGTYSGFGTSSRMFGMRSRDMSRANLTINGPGFEDGEVAIACEGGQLDFSISFITFDHQDLSYLCTFTRAGQPIDSRFELALSSSGILSGLGRAERAGALRHDGRELRFETQRLSGPSLPTGRVPGYVIRTLNGEDIAGMDYRTFRSVFYLPPEGDPEREAAFLAALILATFMDPANTGSD
tara:strand:- start:1138 stop:1824 length:687 start_codon:yes stop_codon:yes gene_type:complete